MASEPRSPARSVAPVAAALNFLLYAAYYVLRPLRDEIASQYPESRDELARDVFLATLGAALLFSALTRRGSRHTVVRGVFAFLALNLALFRLALPAVAGPAAPDLPWVEGAFYVWVTVFVLVAGSAMWSLLTDCFASESAKRTFGLFFFGSTLGQVAASAFVRFSAEGLGRARLLDVALALLVGAALCADRVARRGGAGSGTPLRSTEPLSETLLAGFVAIVRSPHLLRICLYMATYTFCSALLYYFKTDVVGAEYRERSQRIEVLAQLDLVVGLAALAPQLLLTKRVLARAGLGWALAVVPAATALGLVVLALAPGLVAFVALDSLRRVLNFVFAKPSREVLFTGVSTRQRYQAKHAIDTAFYRGSDWLEFELLQMLRPGPAAAAWLGVPVALLGVALGHALGRRHEALVAAGPELSSGSEDPLG